MQFLANSISDKIFSKGTSKILIFISIFLIIFFIRYYLSTLFFNNDFFSFLNWIENIKQFGLNGFYQRDFSPWAQANYPPLINLLFLFFDQIAHSIFKESPATNLLASFYKLPSLILETLLITYLLMSHQKLIALMIALNPAIFYNTVFWGQTDGAVSSLIFFCIILLYKNKTFLGLLIFTTAVLIKQSALVFIPIIFLLLLKKSSLKIALFSLIISVALTWYSFLPFYSNNDYLLFPIQFFIDTIGGQSHQQLASVNAFNLWYLLGFNESPDSLVYGFLTLHQWGQLLTFSIITIILTTLIRSNQLNLNQYLISAGLINLAVFLLLTRMHERYIFPSLILLIPLIYKGKINVVIYSIFSVISFLNLFWVWYFDHQLDISPYFNQTTINIFSLVSLICFGILFYRFFRTMNQHTDIS